MELPDGTVIDSTDSTKKKLLPIKRIVEVAVAKMCPGVDKVLRSSDCVCQWGIAMREGGERIAVIRPENGYGEKGHKKAGIPANTPFLIRLKLQKCLYTCLEQTRSHLLREDLLLHHQLAVD